jgi:hypothetical protein
MEYLVNIGNRVIPTEEGYDVVYESGEFSGSVKYVRYDMDNLVMRGKPVYLMVHSEMGDIIELIHRRRELCSDDFNDLNMEIRNHSRDLVLDYVAILNKV